MTENDMKINWNLPPQKRVKIHFPKDVEKLALFFDWMYNSGDFATVNMGEDVILKARKFAEIEIIEEEESNA